MQEKIQSNSHIHGIYNLIWESHEKYIHGFPGGLQCGRLKNHGSNPWTGKIPWRRAWTLTPVLLPGESQGQRSVAGYSQQGREESDRIEAILLFLFSHSVMSDSTPPWIVARQASLSFTISQSLLKRMFIESVLPPNHPVLCSPPFLLLSIFPIIRVFSNEPALLIRWQKYCSFSFGISPSNE